MTHSTNNTAGAAANAIGNVQHYALPGGNPGNQNVAGNGNPEVTNRGCASSLLSKLSTAAHNVHEALPKPSEVVNYVRGAKNPLRDASIRRETYTKPLATMPENVRTLVSQMSEAEYLEQLKDRAHHGEEWSESLDAQRNSLSDQDFSTAEIRAYRQVTPQNPEIPGPTLEDIRDNSEHPLHGKFSELTAKEAETIALERFVAGEVNELTADEIGGAEDAAFERLQSFAPDGNPIDKTEFFQDPQHVLRPVYDSLVTEQKEIMALEKLLPHEKDGIRAESELNTWKMLSEGASSQRNWALTETRAKISAVGRGLSVFMKKEGIPFDKILERKAAKIIQELNQEPGNNYANFQQLPDESKIQVYEDIVKSSSTSNPNLAGKFLKTLMHLGKH